jgi:hypothetical protein
MLVYRSAWKANSANFRFTAFEEVGFPVDLTLGASETVREPPPLYVRQAPYLVVPPGLSEE